MDRAAPTALRPLRWVIALVGALVAAAALAATAGAGLFTEYDPIQVPPNPMETNIPYVAWDGEHIRNKKCLFFHEQFADEGELRSVVGDQSVDLLLSLTGKFRSEDRSGNPNVWPVYVNDLDGTVRTELNFGPRGAAICWSVDVASLKPGLLIKKLTVNFQAYLDVFGPFGLSIFGGGY